MDFIPWKTSLLTEYWIILERGFEGSIWVLKGGMLWILPISVKNFSHKEDGNWFDRDKWSPGWLYWWLLLNFRIFSVSLEKNVFLYDTSVRSLSLINRYEWGTNGKGWVSLIVPSSVQFSCSVMSNSSQPHGIQQARLPCSSPTPGAYSNSCPST